MRRVLACSLALSLFPLTASAQPAVGGLPASSVTQPPRDTRPATGRSVIRGRVVAADGGQPIRRVEVRITAAVLRVSRRTLTDPDGRYEFRGLLAGQYSISGSKTAFIAWSYGQTRPRNPGKPLVLADNQVADGVNIRLPRGAVITGRITDDFGDTVPNARVTLMRQQFRRGERTLTSATTVTTNDIGEYRMFGLSPGEYCLSAMLPQVVIGGPAGPEAPEGPEARNGYAPTFYPGTTNAGAAQKLTVGLAQTLSEINFALLAARTATVSGIALNSEGRSMGGFVQIVPRSGANGLGGLGGAVRPDGGFTISNVPPGDYMLRGGSGIAPGAPAPANVSPALAFVTVNGEDVTGVVLVPVIPVSLTGRISFEDEGAAQSLKSSVVRVSTLAATVGDAGIGVGSGGSPLNVNADFTFDMKTTPGRMAIRATAPGWQVKTIRVDGRDVTDTEIDVGSEGLRGVEIEMTNRLQEVSGSVVDASGKRVADYAVLLFSQDPTRWTAAYNRYAATSRPGVDSLFKTSTLPSGEYYAIALEQADAVEGQDPEVLKSLMTQASRLSLAPGERRTLTLKLFTVQ